MKSQLNWVLLAFGVGIFVWGCQSSREEEASTAPSGQSDQVADQRPQAQAQQIVNFAPEQGSVTDLYADLVDQWHAWYVEQINDLSLLDPDYDPTDPNARFKPGSEGEFGTTRFGPSSISPGLFSVHEPKGGETTVPPDAQEMIRDLGVKATVSVFGAKMGLLTSESMRPSGFVDGLSPVNAESSLKITKPGEAPVFGFSGLRGGKNYPIALDALDKDEDFGRLSYMTTRKITLDQEECLTCHTKSKLGATAAIFVYEITRLDSP